MLDLLLILIPAVLIIFGVGWWVVKDMTPKQRAVGKFLISLTSLFVAGIITLSFFGGIATMVVGMSILGYKLYTRKS